MTYPSRQEVGQSREEKPRSHVCALTLAGHHCLDVDVRPERTSHTKEEDGGWNVKKTMQQAGWGVGSTRRREKTGPDEETRYERERARSEAGGGVVCPRASRRHLESCFISFLADYLYLSKVPAGLGRK